MTITVVPVTPSFVAEVGDIDLACALSKEDLEAVRAAFWHYAVLVFPGQTLTPQQQLDFAARIGPIETKRTINRSATPSRFDSSFADVSNLTAEGEVWGEDSRRRMYMAGNKLWHTDSSFKYRPGLASLLYATTIAPIGGHTEFSDQRAAYDALPATTKEKLEGLIAEHWIVTSRRRSGFDQFDESELTGQPAVPQMLVRTLPETGRKTLFLAAHAGRIYGMPDAEGRQLIDDLLDHATQRQFVYTHRWRPNDLVMWDNRCTMHRGTDYDDLRWVRDMRRVTVSDVANTCEQAGVTVAA